MKWFSHIPNAWKGVFFLFLVTALSAARELSEGRPIGDVLVWYGGVWIAACVIAFLADRYLPKDPSREPGAPLMRGYLDEQGHYREAEVKDRAP